MAENSVTIALNLDPSQFNAGLAQAQSQLSKMGGAPGFGGKGGVSGVASSVIEFNSATKKAAKETSHFASTIAYLTSIMRGNISSFNVLGAIKGLTSFKPFKMPTTQAGVIPVPSGAFGAGGIPNAITAPGAGITASSAATLAGGEGAAGAATSAVGAEGGMTAALAGSLGAAVSLLGGILAAVLVLGSIGAGVAGLVVVMQAVMFALKPILLILNGIGKVLGAALMPMSLVIVQLLQPLIYMLMPLIRVMNLLFAPLRRYIANQMVARASELQAGGATAVSAYLEILIGSSAIFFSILFTEVLKMIVNGVSSIIAGLATALADIFLWTLPEDQKAKVRKNIEDYFQTIADTVNGKIDKLEMKFVAGLSTPTPTAEVAVLKPSTPQATSLIDQATTLLSGIASEANGILAGIDLQKIAGDASQYLGEAKTTAQNTWLDILSKAETYLPDLVSAFTNFMNDLILIANKMIGGLNWMLENVPGLALATGRMNLEGKYEPYAPIAPIPVSDFVLQPGGRLIKTSPQDYLFGMQPRQNASASVPSLSVEINVEGSVDDKTSRFIVDEIERVISSKLRSISRG